MIDKNQINEEIPLGGAQRGPGTRRGYDLETNITITLEDVAKGVERLIQFTRLGLCPACVGAGEAYNQKCSDCKGSGQVAEKRILTVRIPPGVHHDMAVRVPGEGEPSLSGGLQGDLHVVVKVAPHKIFKRQDDNLELQMPVSSTQADLGATINVPTLDAGHHALTINPGTQPGEVLRVVGKGLPNLRSPTQRGDLNVVLSDEKQGFLHKIKEYLT